jgi:hypothetical protein
MANGHCQKSTQPSCGLPDSGTSVRAVLCMALQEALDSGRPLDDHMTPAAEPEEQLVPFVN